MNKKVQDNIIRNGIDDKGIGSRAKGSVCVSSYILSELKAIEQSSDMKELSCMAGLIFLSYGYIK